jgi:hypothetical protein
VFAILLAWLCCRRKAREQKAYAKQVQAEKVKERAQEKKRQIQQVQQLRKQREKSVSGGLPCWRHDSVVVVSHVAGLKRVLSSTWHGSSWSADRGKACVAETAAALTAASSICCVCAFNASSLCLCIQCKQSLS